MKPLSLIAARGWGLGRRDAKRIWRKQSKQSKAADHVYRSGRPDDESERGRDHPLFTDP
jgi:hypothetical protein